MPRFPDNGCCPICNWYEFHPVLVKVKGGVRETGLLQCGACTAVFKEPALFVRAAEFKLTSSSAEVMARLDPPPKQIESPGGGRTPWVPAKLMPITDTEVGKYMVGIGHSGWFGGVIVKGYGLSVEAPGHSTKLMSASAARYYLIVDPPPPIVD